MAADTCNDIWGCLTPGCTTIHVIPPVASLPDDRTDFEAVWETRHGHPYTYWSRRT